ncbi:EAL domain-containing protein [Clostridium chrysemydis]|uniref:EAL domain-containing protein n=1 Tax=Clostridium chrysemydis TaxID=2665504 RepID=UPI0018835AE4|nr:EAL domain-containing protein [Clostridium chrysemydis]
MKQNLYRFYKIVFLSIILLLLTPVICNAEDDNKIVKVGFYEYGSYYYYDKNKNQTGYYDELLKHIAKELDMNYEYVNVPIDDGLKDLKNGDIDLLFGLNKTPEREKYYAFTNHYIANEDYAVYTNKDIKSNTLQSLKGLKFGYIPGEANNEYLLKILKEKNIPVDLVYCNSYKQTDTALRDKKVDFIVSTIFSDLEKEKFNSFYKFSCGPVYIAAPKKDEALIEKIDTVLLKNESQVNLYNKYFNKYFIKTVRKNIVIITLFILVLIFINYIFLKKLKAKRKYKKNRKQISEDLLNKKYIAFYQPIINPKTNKIIGIESLLRKISEDKILTPNLFIKDFEKYNMIFELSIWLVNNAIHNYNIIKTFKSFEEKKFYISVNISFIEIENEEFVKRLIEISKEHRFIKNTICLEIIEKFKTTDIEKIQESILKLKEAGYIIALDDFGVDYSNLNLLTSIDSNIVKLDKYFMDDITESILKQKILNFICDVSEISKKSIVCEGIEDLKQKTFIKNIDYKKIFIQGYYYSKPLPLESLAMFEVDSKK